MINSVLILIIVTSMYASRPSSASVLLLFVPRTGHFWRDGTLARYQSDLRRTALQVINSVLILIIVTSMYAVIAVELYGRSSPQFFDFKNAMFSMYQVRYAGLPICPYS